MKLLTIALITLLSSPMAFAGFPSFPGMPDIPGVPDIVDKFKGEQGEQGEQGVAGVDGVDGVDGVTTVVNEYDKSQVDIDFVSEAESTVTNANQDYYNANQRKEIALAQSRTDFAQDARIQSNADGVAKNTAWNVKQDGQISALQDDVDRLDGMIAASTALNSIVVVPNYNGTFHIGIGAGHYRGNNAVGLALQTGGKDFQIKATVAGSDADNFDDLVYGVGVGVGF